MKKRRGKPNLQLQMLFMSLKKQTGVSSRDIARELEVSPQTVSTMSGHLDELKLCDLAKIGMLFGMKTESLVTSILMRSMHRSYYNPDPDGEQSGLDKAG